MTNPTDAELDTLEAKHTKCICRSGTHCDECLENWPCPTRRLIAEVREWRTRAARVIEDAEYIEARCAASEYELYEWWGSARAMYALYEMVEATKS